MSSKHSWNQLWWLSNT